MFCRRLLLELQTGAPQTKIVLHMLPLRTSSCEYSEYQMRLLKCVCMYSSSMEIWQECACFAYCDYTVIL